MKLKVALLQIMPGESSEENRVRGMEWCRKAKAMGADIALFPEMWSTGYTIPEHSGRVRQKAISLADAFMESYRSLARELNMAIGVTLLEAYDPLPRNTLCLIDRFGTDVLIYAKVHTCDFGEEKYLTPGDDFYVTDLNTEAGMVKVGAMICFDREMPESARILMLKGAEIILVPNACPMEINRISQLRARAYENMVGIATANYPKGQPDCNGHSSAFDGIAYRPEDSSSRDTLIIEAGEQEGIYMAEFSLNEIREYRSREVHGNAYRHPDQYAILVSKEKNEPFIRKDYTYKAIQCMRYSNVLEEQRKRFEECGCNLDAQYEQYGLDGPFWAKVIEPGHIYEVGYPKCYCPEAQNGKVKDIAFCECSRQSIIYVLQSLIPEQEFTVEMIETVVGGAQQCRFRVTLAEKPQI